MTALDFSQLVPGVEAHVSGTGYNAILHELRAPYTVKWRCSHAHADVAAAEQCAVSHQAAAAHGLTAVPVKRGDGDWLGVLEGAAPPHKQVWACQHHHLHADLAEACARAQVCTLQHAGEKPAGPLPLSAAPRPVQVTLQPGWELVVTAPPGTAVQLDHLAGGEVRVRLDAKGNGAG